MNISETTLDNLVADGLASYYPKRVHDAFGKGYTRGVCDMKNAASQIVRDAFTQVLKADR